MACGKNFASQPHDSGFSPPVQYLGRVYFFCSPGPTRPCEWVCGQTERSLSYTNVCVFVLVFVPTLHYTAS